MREAGRIATGGGATGFGVGGGALRTGLAGGGAAAGTTLSNLGLLAVGSPISPEADRSSSAVRSLAATLYVGDVRCTPSPAHTDVPSGVVRSTIKSWVFQFSTSKIYYYCAVDAIFCCKVIWGNPEVTVLDPTDLFQKFKTCFSQKRYGRVID